MPTFLLQGGSVYELRAGTVPPNLGQLQAKRLLQCFLILNIHADCKHGLRLSLGADGVEVGAPPEPPHALQDDGQV